MANYRKLKVHEVGTDTYIDYEANVSEIFFFLEIEISNFFFYSSTNEYHVHVLSILVRRFSFLIFQLSRMTVNVER